MLPPTTRMTAVLACLLVLCGGGFERAVAAADVIVPAAGLCIEADSLEADEIGVRLLALNDAADEIRAAPLGRRPVAQVVDPRESPNGPARSVLACRAPPAVRAS